MRNFLVGNALYWLERYDVDGLRVDAVASMLYRDYSRKAGEWVPNVHGGRENLEAIAFLKRINEVVGVERPQAVTLAEESTAFPAVSRPTYAGGLGFHYKWNMGWMHDTLAYMARDPIHRKYHHGEMTFGLVYAFNENFVLPISHDEVVHGKGSLLDKMPGDRWQKFANLRAYYGFMCGHPGKKLLFMGCEFAQEREWNHDQSLDWHLLGDRSHAGVQRLVRDLNRLYRATPALHQRDFDGDGFEWIDHEDAQRSRAELRARRPRRRARCRGGVQLHAAVQRGYRLGVPRGRHLARAAEHRLGRTTAAAMSAAPFGAADSEPWRATASAQSLAARPAAAGHRLPRMDTSLTSASASRRAVPGSTRAGRAWPLGAALGRRRRRQLRGVLGARAGQSSCACSTPPARTNCARLRCRHAATTSGTATLPGAGAGLVYGLRAHGPWRPTAATASTRTSCCSTPTRARSSADFDWRAEQFGADPEHAAATWTRATTRRR